MPERPARDYVEKQEAQISMSGHIEEPMPDDLIEEESAVGMETYEE